MAAARLNLARYLTELETLVTGARARGARVILLRPPLPPRTRALVPGEADYDAALRGAAARTGAELHDLSEAIDDAALYFDMDHLNRAGVVQLFERHLAGMLGK